MDVTQTTFNKMKCSPNGPGRHVCLRLIFSFEKKEKFSLPLNLIKGSRVALLMWRKEKLRTSAGGLGNISHRNHFPVHPGDFVLIGQGN